MGFRKIIGVIVAVLVFLGVVLCLGNFLESVMGYSAARANPLLRLPVLFVSFLVASIVYNLIKGDEIEPENKSKTGISSEEISRKLAERRNRD
ncbi:MAG: hypothetical protein H5T96_09150 [Tissierellales bacterium]|nr:hypothetical protein [Tissierellales bacterium]